MNNVREADVFQDYDALIINPESLDDLYEILTSEYSRDVNVLKNDAGINIALANKERREQTTALLQRGGVVVCFLHPVKRLFYNMAFEGEDRWQYVTNYDWLMTLEDFNNTLGTIIHATGKTIEVIDSSHPFSEYIKTKPSWSAYFNINDCKNWKVLASAYGTHALSLAKRTWLGHIVFLPSYYDHRNSELLESCIIKLLGDKETTPQPSWAKSILVPGQEELNSKITEFSDNIDTLTEQRKALIDNRDKLERWKKLLYAKGKHELEPVVREALTLIGCQVEPQPDKDSDGLVSCDYGTALLEIAGSKGTIKIRKLGELTTNMGNFMSEKESPVKGILIGNPFCEETLDNRPPENSQKDLFSKELIGSAEKQDIPALLTTDLHEVVCMILNDKFTDAEKLSLQQKLFTGKGLVRLV